MVGKVSSGAALEQGTDWRQPLVSGNLIYMEGGGSRDLDARCREGMKRLLDNTGFRGRQPRIVACGSRSDAYKDFKTGFEHV